MNSICLALALISSSSPPAPQEKIPEDFPRFLVPGHEKELESLRRLYYLHYLPGGPLATLWDEWLSGSTLWPALSRDGRMHSIRKRWTQALSSRRIDPEGYVATHQHASIAHQEGWPFPFWKQGGPGTWGWHFSLQGVPAGWHGTTEKTQEGWELEGGLDKGISQHAWNIELNSPGGRVRTPPLLILPDQSPFIQLRWRAKGLEDAEPYLEWATEKNPDFDPEFGTEFSTEFSTERRFYFPPARESQGIIYTMIQVERNPAWKGRITRLGIHFDNRTPGASVGIQALFTQYDTRHNINNQNFIRGACQYFWWTRDLSFLRENLGRLRLALLYLMEELGGLREKCIVTPFTGHSGRSGLEIGADGKKAIHSGRGIGNNYWDLLPMGHKDAYATIHYFDTLNSMARLEEEIEAHPEWGMPGGPLKTPPAKLRRHAEEVKAGAGKLFWNDATGRFTCGIDVDGKAWDYGFTFINCEAIHYGLATSEQAESILAWLSGERIVEGDTSRGTDIYHWRFGPRSTTRRNVEYYGWFWSGPETIPWGGQVQDGGAVLGFSYHDLQSRLKVRGPDSAWKRLQEIIRWYDEVEAAGGYRAYYEGGTRGTLQGGGRPGGLGLDKEFFESILVPQILLSGFLGFRPSACGFEIHPKLPRDWPELRITRIHLHRLILDITASRGKITIKTEGKADYPLSIDPPPGRWQILQLNQDGNEVEKTSKEIRRPGEGLRVSLREGGTVILEGKPAGSKKLRR